MNTERTREGNMDVLRILAALGVIILHYNNEHGGGGLTLVKWLSPSFIVLSFLEAISLCAVNVFILISGYYSCQKTSVRIIKPIMLIFEVIFFRVLFTVASILLGFEEFQLKKLIGSFLPLDYYVILFSCLFVISPYINITLKSLSKDGLKKLIVILLVFFTFLPFITDSAQYITGESFSSMSTISTMGSGYGHTIVHFVVMYICGACLRLLNPVIKRIKLIITMIICSLIICLLIVISFVLKVDITFASSYCNPFIILFSLAVFIVFHSYSIRENKVIKVLAKASFTVYITHSYFIAKVGVDKIAGKSSVFLQLTHVVISCLTLYAVGVVAHMVYSFIEGHLLYKILPKKIKEGTVSPKINV